MKHSFKPHEWPSWVTKRVLVGLIERYQREFGDLKNIKHFFEIFNELYWQDIPQEHHIRCIATILGIEAKIDKLAEREAFPFIHSKEV